MATSIQLSPDQVIHGRIFTHPSHTYFDRRILCYMVMRLCHILEADRIFSFQTSSIVLQQLEPDGRHHRLVLANPQGLAHLKELTVVGFLGQRRNDADPEPIVAVDRKLLEEISTHSGLLSYSSMELTNGDYANCVIFKDEAAVLLWSKSETHKRTALVLAPDYYFSIRIYNGILVGGVADPESLRLNQVKYYAYDTGDVWHATRPLTEALNSPKHLAM